MNNLLKLEKAYNVRTLGNYTTTNGKAINGALFLRGDCLSKLNQADIEFLLNYNLGTVIDLRSSDEIEKKPNALRNNPNVKYFNIPLIANQEGVPQDLTQLFMENPVETFPKFYIEMLHKSKSSFKEIFEIIEQNLDKITLFHCTAGKDRTGVVSMLIQGLAGVSTEDILSNYIVTYENNRKNPDFNKVSQKLPVEIFYSTKEYLMPSIQYIEENYGTYYNYLLSTGLNEETLNNILEKLVI